MYSAMSSIPSGGPPGGTHTQELWYSLRGIDARLESVLSTYKCLCDACCARSQPLILLFLFSYFGLKNCLTAKTDFLRPENMSLKFIMFCFSRRPAKLFSTQKKSKFWANCAKICRENLLEPMPYFFLIVHEHRVGSPEVQKMKTSRVKTKCDPPGLLGT